MKWHFQFTPHDTHDWDAQSWPVLIDMEWQGKMRKVVLHANRNGFFYVLDRTTGEFLRASQLIDKVTWATGIDKKGRPIPVPGKDPTPEGNWVCPSVKGATNWMGQSYNPGTGLLYVLTLEQCGMYNSSSQEPVPMKNFPGGGATEEGGQVILRAIDPKTGKRAWEYPMTGAGRMWTGIVSTAGGVVFSGDDDGHLVALEARPANICGISTWESCSRHRRSPMRWTASSMSPSHRPAPCFHSACSSRPNPYRFRNSALNNQGAVPCR